MGDGNPFLGRPVQSNPGGGVTATPHKRIVIIHRGWSPSIEGDHNCLYYLHENVKFFLYSTLVFVEYIGLEIIKELNKVIFIICGTRATEKCAKLLF